MLSIRWLFVLGSIITACLASLLPAVSAQAAARVALVVGNSDYASTGRLANPVNDASLMAQTLRQLGFTLVGGKAQLNLDKTHFDRLAQKFGKDAQGADVALFYYAGHGVQIDGTNYLVPVDANPQTEADADFQMIDAMSMLRQMESSHARLKLMILDACRNNPFAERGLRALGGGLAQMQAPEGTMIAFSTQPGHKALDGDSGHSPYTAALADTMREPGLDIFRTFNAVGIKVASVTHGRQRPWVSSSPINGDFYFVPETAKKLASKVGGDSEEALRFFEAERLGTREAFDAFLKTYSTGSYASLARAERNKIVAKAADELASREADAADRAKLAAEIKAAQEAIAEAVRETAAAKAAREAAEKAAKFAVARGEAAAKAANEAIERAKREAASAKAAQKAAEARAGEALAHQLSVKNLSTAHQASKPPNETNVPAGGMQVAAAVPPSGSPSSVSPPVLSQADIAQLLKFHLREVGCDAGDGGLWDVNAKRALQEFNRHAGTHLDVESPTVSTLQAVQSAHGRVCPLVCGRGTRREGEECVAITCKQGSSLTADGKCRQITKKKTFGLVMGSPQHLRLRSACRGGDFEACETLCSNGGYRACKKLNRISGR
jgi:uncharacterized caspase-like protein